MQEYKLDDPRDAWSKARRMEVVRHAHALGHTDIVEQMPKDLAVKLLKARGVSPPSIPPRTIASGPRSGDTDLNSHRYSGPAQPSVEQETVTMSAEDVLMRDWQAQQEQRKEPTFQELRRMCREKGIPWLRTDTAVQLKAKLRGEDASQLGQ